jgi:hypothetical protein
MVQGCSMDLPEKHTANDDNKMTNSQWQHPMMMTAANNNNSTTQQDNHNSYQ